MSAQEEDNVHALYEDKRLSFEEAVRYVLAHQAAAFCVHPVFEEEDDAQPSGARVFLLAADGRGGWYLRYAAGRFFSGAYAADEILAAEDVPQRVRELRFLPTRFEESWFSEQIQRLIHRLMMASGTAAPHMPDYENAPQRRAAAGVVFPVAFIDAAKKPH